MGETVASPVAPVQLLAILALHQETKKAQGEAMWPIPTREQEIVTVAVGRQRIYCGRLNQADQSFPLTFVSQKIYELPERAIGPLTIYNQTAIVRAIRSFLEEQSCPGARVAVALSPPQIKSAIVTQSPTQSAPYHGFEGAQWGWDWQYQYLYPDETEGFIYYACGMPYTLRHQWHLMATQTPFNLVTLTSGSMALLTLYEAANGSSFRRSQFATRMRQHRNMITRLFSADTAHRILHSNTPTPSEQLLPALVNCGLFVSERENL